MKKIFSAMTAPSAGPKSKDGPSDELAEHYVNTFCAFLGVAPGHLPVSVQESKGREKLTKLAGPQLLELSTDVYDESQRRSSPESPDFLLPRDGFHPKRNQGRKKLHVLSPTRFRDLCTDIVLELYRRYPQLDKHEEQLEQEEQQRAAATGMDNPSNHPVENAQWYPSPVTNAPHAPQDPQASPVPDQQYHSTLDPRHQDSYQDRSLDHPDQNYPQQHATEAPEQHYPVYNGQHYPDMSTAHSPAPEHGEHGDHAVHGEHAEQTQPSYPTIQVDTVDDFDNTDQSSMGPNGFTGNGSIHSVESKGFDFEQAHAEEDAVRDVASTEDPVHVTDDVTPDRILDSPKSPENNPPSTTRQPLKATTIIPQKSTLVEEDEDDEEDEEDGEQDDGQGIGNERGLTHEEDSEHNAVPEQVYSENANRRSREMFMRNSLRDSTLDSIAEDPEEETSRELHEPLGDNDRNSQKFNSYLSVGGQATPPESDFYLDGMNMNMNRTSRLSQMSRASFMTENPDELRDQIRDRDEQIQMLVAEGSRMDENINKLEAKLADAEAAKTSLVEENGRLHELVSELELKKDELASQIDQLKSNHGEELSNIQDQLRQAQEQSDKVHTDYRELQSKHDELNERSVSLGQQLAETQNLVNTHSNDNNGLSKQLTELQSQVSTHEEHKKTLDEQLANLLEKVTISEETINDLRKQLAEKDRMLEENSSSSRGIDGGDITGMALGAGAGALVGAGVSSRSDPELQQKYDQLQKEHEKLNLEFQEQQRITEQVKAEASEFLEEMRRLASHRSADSSYSTIDDESSSKIQSLKVEVQEWKSRYLRAKSRLRDVRSSTHGAKEIFQTSIESAVTPIGKSSPYYDPDHGRIRDTTVTRFQVSMDDFLTKSRTDPGNLMDHLHNLVVATRGVNQDVTDFSKDSEELGELSMLTSLVSNTANHLITSTRNHTTSGGLSPVSVLDAAASDLTAAVISLIKTAKIRPGSDADDVKIPPRPQSSEFGSIADTGEIHVANNINPSDDNASDTTATSATTMTTATTTTPMNGARGLGTVERIINEENDVDSEDAQRRITVKKRYANEYSREISQVVQNFDVEDPDNTIPELQAYLEEQTVAVIESIQSLLTGIRDNSIMGKLRPHIGKITVSVDQMIEATGNSMKQTKNWLLKDKGEYILANLADCSQRLTNIMVDTEHLNHEDHPEKYLKQRLAGILFDMAKCTKELVKTVEEVSLTSDIHHIDEQLAA